MISNDISKFDDMSVSAINRLVEDCPTKTLLYTCGPKTDSYPISSRIKIEAGVAHGGLKLTWSAEYYS